MAQSSASTLGQLLSGRFAGLQAMSTGATGTGSRIRIRGQSSLLLGNDPLIIVDGVRLFQAPNKETSSMPSRADDINVEDIEEIEILRIDLGKDLRDRLALARQRVEHRFADTHRSRIS